MTYIITINQIDAEHYASVRSQMLVLGAPTIRCARDEAQGVLVALEGSHRLAAAIELGLAPNLVVLDDDALLSCDELGFDDCGWFEGEPARAVDIRGRIAGSMGTYPGCPVLKLPEA